MIHLAVLVISSSITDKERLKLADLLSSFAADVLKGQTGTPRPYVVDFNIPKS